MKSATFNAIQKVDHRHEANKKVLVETDSFILTSFNNQTHILFILSSLSLAGILSRSTDGFLQANPPTYKPLCLHYEGSESSVPTVAKG